jgi:hypothetical protein
MADYGKRFIVSKSELRNGEYGMNTSLLLSSDYVSLIVQRFCQYPLIKIGSKFPFPGMTG